MEPGRPDRDARCIEPAAARADGAGLSMAQGKPFTAVVLAAQRAGAVNPLAARAGVSHKCLVPIAGKPLIVHVVEALARHPGLAAIRIAVEPEVHGVLAELLAPFGGGQAAIECVPSALD